MRTSGRENLQKRELTFKPGIAHPTQVSVITQLGSTVVLCGVSVLESVPPFLRGKGEGWLTSEYAMLPLSSQDRISRDRIKVNSRVIEIQRFIGRSLRSMVNLKFIGERTLQVDCDVLVADGGTRTASVNGACVALSILLGKWIREKIIPASALRTPVAALSFGIVNNAILVDLDYQEDSSVDADVNVVMNANNDLIEIQGTSERTPIKTETMQELILLAKSSVNEVFQVQAQFLKNFSNP
jgi:ribonuclease PH